MKGGNNEETKTKERGPCGPCVHGNIYRAGACRTCRKVAAMNFKEAIENLKNIKTMLHGFIYADKEAHDHIMEAIDIAIGAIMFMRAMLGGSDE